MTVVKRSKVKIQSLKGLYNPFVNNNFDRSANVNNYHSNALLRQPKCDVISFSAKKYDSDSIINPTYHCAYCGCKVYNESQIDSIAKEILNDKSGKLEGRVRSVLEKLEGAKHSQELAIAKRMENEDEIEFFKKFLDTASKHAYLKGDAIFEQQYHMDSETAMKTLTANLRPLLKTIDHVTPQKEDKENQHSDINLVEACYCCNHDLKNGSSFNEFYMMFPTIKNNMPKEKFDYALAQILDSAKTGISQRLSAKNMLELLKQLFVQRTESSNQLYSIDVRIKGCKTGIIDSIEACKQEISEKEKEQAAAEQKFAELSTDPEYSAMLKRIQLNSDLEAAQTKLDTLRERRSKLSNSLNSLNSVKKPQKNQKQKKDELTPEEKKAKAEQLKTDIAATSEDITNQEATVFEVELNISELDAEFPPVDVIQAKKSKADSIINAHNSIEKESRLLAEREAKRVELEESEKNIQSQIDVMPEGSKSFVLEAYSDDEQAQYKKYKELKEALSFIDEHPNGGNIRIIINQMAREPIAAEIAQMEQMKIISDYNDNEKRKDLQAQLQSVQKSKGDVIAMIHNSEKAIRNSKKATEYTSIEEAQEQSAKYAEDIRRLNDKQNYINLPKRISQLKAEIILLNQTIKDLNAQIEKIEKEYNS